jgi:hypothetical protein
MYLPIRFAYGISAPQYAYRGTLPDGGCIDHDTWFYNVRRTEIIPSQYLEIREYLPAYRTPA